MLADTDTELKGPLHAGVAALSLEHEVTTLVGDAADVEEARAQQSESLFFNPDGYLCGRLAKAVERAREEGVAVALNTDSGRVLVCPDHDIALAQMSETTLRWLSSVRMPDDRATLEVPAEGCPDEPENMALRRGSDGLLWMTTLWAARGRVPRGTSLNAEVRLARWPNMTRLLLFPHSLRIAALWAKEPVSLLDSARILGIPQRFVFSFYSAAHALGLAETQRVAEEVVEPMPSPRPEPEPSPVARPEAEPIEALATEKSPRVQSGAARANAPMAEASRVSSVPTSDEAAAHVGESPAAVVAPAATSRPRSRPTPPRTKTMESRTEASRPVPALGDSEAQRLDEAIKNRNERLRQLRDQERRQPPEPKNKPGFVARFFGALFGRNS